MPLVAVKSVGESSTLLTSTTLLTRKTILVSNHGPFAIYVSTASLGGEQGIRVAPDATVTFPTGTPLYAICSVAQAGGSADQTVVMELE